MEVLFFAVLVIICQSTEEEGKREKKRKGQSYKNPIKSIRWWAPRPLWDLLFLFLCSFKDACPTHCKTGQTCNSADSGCPECENAYYGRQCQHRIQCYTVRGVEYRGTRNTTSSGITCQRWDSDSPHAHTRKDSEANYCRNPSSEYEPWCYTTDPRTRWRVCDVPNCDTQCRAPNLDVPFTDITNPPDDGFAVGFIANIQVVCGSGYEPQGVRTTTATCQSDKTWSQTTLPSCKKIKCKSPTLPANSKIDKEHDEYEPQDKITIVCNTGYTLEGNNEITCQSDKTWSSTSAVCRKNQCQPPALPANSKLGKEKDRYQYQDTITFVCNVGYTLDGNNEMTCQSDKTWSTASGSCSKIQCPSPTLPYNSKSGNIMNKYEYQDTVTIVCDTGYIIQGNNVTTCQSDNTWSSTSAVCKKIQCRSPTLPDNSALVNAKDKYEYENKITFVCRHGYSLQGNNEMICQANKLWSSASGSCEKQVAQANGVWVIVGATGWGILGIVVAVLVIVFLLRRKRKSIQQRNDPMYINALGNIRTEEHTYEEVCETNANVETEEIGHPSANHYTYCNAQETTNVECR